MINIKEHIHMNECSMRDEFLYNITPMPNVCLYFHVKLIFRFQGFLTLAIRTCIYAMR